MPQVTIVPTGESFAADPGEPVLTAALRAGLNLPHSCKGGHCASCRARLLSGTTTYPTRELPAGITPDEALTFLFEHFSSVTHAENLGHRLRLFKAELEDRKA